MKQPRFRIPRWILPTNGRRFRAAVEGTAIGLALGLIDIHSSGEDWFNTGLAYLIAGFVLGLRHGVRSWQAWGPLGWCLYLLHRIAIARGYRPPYVEDDAARAILTLYVLCPAGLGLALGAFVRFVCIALWETREAAPGVTGHDRSVHGNRVATPCAEPDGVPSRPPAGSSAVRKRRQQLAVWEWMVIIALIAIQLSAVRGLVTLDPFFGLSTFYSERYSETAFRTLRVGMSSAEVEAIVGPPLRIVPWNQSNEMLWAYSDRPDHSANYHRRWVFFQDNKVTTIVNDFWVD